MRNNWLTCWLVLPILAAGVAGCRKDEAKATKANLDTDAVKAKLARADAYDGKTDKVVARCTICGLRMDGMAEHSESVGEYTLRFCSAGCVKRFEKDPAKAIETVEIPDG